MSDFKSSAKTTAIWCLRYLKQGWGYACYLAWVFFLRDELGIFTAAPGVNISNHARVASLLAAMACSVVIALFAHHISPLRHNRSITVAIGIIGSMGTVTRFIAQNNALEASTLIIGCIICGATMAYIVLTWLERFMDEGLHCVVWTYFICSLACIPICSFIAILPAGMVAIIIVALPVLSVISLYTTQESPALGKTALVSNSIDQYQIKNNRSSITNIVRILIVVLLSTIASQSLRIQGAMPAADLSTAASLAINLIPSAIAAAVASVIATYAYAFHTSVIFYVLVPAASIAALLTMALPGNTAILVTSTVIASLCDQLIASLAICLFFDAPEQPTLRNIGLLEASMMAGSAIGNIPAWLHAGSLVEGICVLVCMIAIPLIVMSSMLAFSMKQSAVTPVSNTTDDSSTIQNIEHICHDFELTQRERDVLLIWGTGHTGACIEERLGITRNTVRTHLSHIYQKTGVKTKEELLQLIESYNH